MAREDILLTIAEILDVKKEELKENTSLYESLGVDSTEMVEIRIGLKKKFGVEIKEGEISNKQVLKDIVDLVEKKIKEKDGNN